MVSTRALEASPVSLGDRLKDDVQLYCPLFQRRYVWGKSQIDQLWRDIDTIIDGQYSKRFLGALVFDDERSSTAGQAGLYWIIDGQQRMTTMVLTIVALASHARRYGQDGFEIAEDLYRQYIVSRKRESKNQPKLRPTLRDTRQFNDVLRSAFGEGFDLDIDVEREAGESDGSLLASYKLIQRQIETRTTAGADGGELDDDGVVERIETLRDTLLDSLEFVEIRLGDSHDPNEVFDRLNAEGVKLGIIDLVRNDVLKRLRDDARTALRLYNEEWKPFEEAFASDAAKAGYFFPFALTVDPSITKAGTFKALSTRWSSGDFVDDQMDPRDEMLTVMRDLRRHQPSYNAIHSGRLNVLDDELVEGVRRLNVLNRPSSSYPYFMQLLTAAESDEVDLLDARKSIDVVESFLVRRALLGIEPTGLHAIFKRLWADAGANPHLVRREITSTTVIFPGDEAVKRAVDTGNLYARRVASYALAEYERSYTKGDVIATFPPMTIDHLLPQDLSGDWADLFSDEEHGRWLHTWANLVPLSNEANAGKSSSGWASARSRLSNETVFATTKHVYDRYDSWDEEALANRSAELQAWAVERWPSFDELL